jgi:hypothetical protein
MGYPWLFMFDSSVLSGQALTMPERLQGSYLGMKQGCAMLGQSWIRFDHRKALHASQTIPTIPPLIAPSAVAPKLSLI